MKKAAIIGSFDTKGEEFLFVKTILEDLGVPTLTVDVGVLGEPHFQPDISSAAVAEAAGMTLANLRAGKDRGRAVDAMAKGIGPMIRGLYTKGEIGGIFGMGGTAGTTVGAYAMKEVPIGAPKLLLSTVAPGNTRPYVGVKDIAMMYSVVDIAGLNLLSRRILSNAAFALAGMIQHRAAETELEESKPTIGITMFGVTTPCVTIVREILQQEGFDILVFHATGTGGMAMEELVRDGFIHAVVDVTTTELADELVGGIFSAGPNRMEAAALKGIPQVVSVGALDMVNFGEPHTVPAVFHDRTFYQHNPTTTLMRTTIEENRTLGRKLADNLNKASGPTVVVFPKGGVSLLDCEGQAFDGPKERQALYDGIREKLNENVVWIETEHDLNATETAHLIADQLIAIVKR